MKKGLSAIILALICAISCTFGLAACNTAESPDQNGQNDQHGTQTVAVESVSLSASTLTLDIGEESTLTATVSPDNATNKEVTWSVSPAGIVTVEGGKVTAVAAGTATVTATAGGKSANCTVTVNVPVTHEVTESEWDAAVSEEITAATMSSAMPGVDIQQIVKFDTENNYLYVQTPVGIGSSASDTVTYYPAYVIITEESGAYYSYTAEDDEGWVREPITKENFGSQFNMYTTSIGMIVSALDGQYNSFTYSNGAYSAEDVEIAAVGTAGKITVTFTNGELEKLEIEVNLNGVTMSATIELGAVEIEIPENFTEIPTPAGNTYVFSDAVSDDVDAASLATIKASYEGMTIAFGTDGTATITAPSNSAVMKGSYTQSSDTLSITITEGTVNGEPIEGTSSTQNFTIDSDSLTATISIGNIELKLIYALQTAE